MAEKIRTKSIRQTAVFKAGPKEIYELLMDSKKHSAFSGGAARISRKVGGRFTAYDDYASGVNVKLVPGKLIVQTWRASDWPKAHYSTITFQLEKKGTGTKLTFIQTGVPIDQYEDVKQGWKDWYWEKMKEYLGED